MQLVDGPFEVVGVSAGASPAVLAPATHTMFLSHAYRFVVVLDFSPSMVRGSTRAVQCRAAWQRLSGSFAQARVHDDGGLVVLDEMQHTLETLLRRLIVPFKVPGSSPGRIFTPVLHVSVLAQPAPLAQANYPAKVLVQNAVVTHESLPALLAHIEAELLEAEDAVAAAFQRFVRYCALRLISTHIRCISINSG